MTGILLAAGASDDPISAAARGAPIRLRTEDSLKSVAVPVRGVPAFMGALVIGSLAIHAALLAMAIVTSRPPEASQQKEIAVEIVKDVPQPKAPDTPRVEHAKNQLAKLESPSPEQPKPKPPTPKLAEPKPPEPKPPEPKRSEAAKAPPKPTPVPPRPQLDKPPPPKTQDDTRRIEDLRKELAELRAQQAALSEHASSPPTSASGDPQTGPLAGSLQAIALPSVGDGIGDVVGYQQLVFSQLAKAKGDEEYHGQAGTTGVRFEIDAEGRLLNANVAIPSGNPTLDTRALDIVRRAAPFPPPPKDADRSFVANVNFLPAKP